MLKKQQVYVVGLDVLKHYPGIVPETGEASPTSSVINLAESHLVIPTVVVRELSKMTKESSVAHKMLRQLRNLVEGDIHTMEETYNLRASVPTGFGQQQLSILPVHQNFCKCLSFRPSDDDVEGQIILTALAVAFVLAGLRIDGSELKGLANEAILDKVILLTNDDGLAIRARERGIYTQKYNHDCSRDHAPV